MNKPQLDKGRFHLLLAKVRSPKEIQEKTEFLKELSLIVRSSWEELRESERELLTIWAYLVVGPDSDTSTRKKLEWMWFVALEWMTGAICRISGSGKVFEDYSEAKADLTNAILDAIEMENDGYQAAIIEALNGEWEKVDFGPGGAREWLESISE